MGRPITGPPPAAWGRNGRWVKLGDVSVDSSQIGICDPGYAESPNRHLYSNGRRNVTDDLDVQDWCSGVSFTAGFGDGGYDVWGWVVDYQDLDGSVDERVAQIVITLIDDEDLEHWNAND